MGLAAAQASAQTRGTSTPALAKAPPPAARPRLRLVQRSCECGASAGPSGRCASCNETLLRPDRAQGAPDRGGEIAPPLVHQALDTPGETLSEHDRIGLEGILGHDLSRVRIHTGPVADASARAVGAKAYTVGQDIVFRAGLFQPHTHAGRQLLAHELTHAVQQADAAPARPLRIGPAHDAHEHAAAAAAASLPAHPKPKAPPAPTVKPPAPKPAAPKPAALKPAPPTAAAKTPIAAKPAVVSTPVASRAATAAPAHAAPAPRAQSVQRDTDGAAPAESGSWLDKLGAIAGDAFWTVVDHFAPAALAAMLREISQKGIVGFIKGKLSGVFNGLFSGLSPAQGGMIATLLATFTQLLSGARTVLGALAHNDCKPLFAALGKLGDTLGAMAGEAWDKLKDFLAPVGDFFSGLWTKFGKPVAGFLADVASDTWNAIKAIGAQIWSIVSDIGASAWGWLKGKLGITGGGDDQGGLMAWVEGKLGEAWDALKAQLDPVITPMKAFADKVIAALPLGAIMNLRETIHEWLQHAGGMVGSLQDPKGVTANQASLRQKLLPAIKAAIVSLGGKISDAGGWVAAQVGGVVQAATGLLSSLKSNPILGAVSGALDWLGEKAKALGDWAQNGVKAVFDIAGQAVAKLSSFVDPVLGVLQKLASLIGNVVKALPGLVMGPFWMLIPSCIKDPIKDFIIQHILSEIPVISTFVKIPGIWTKIQNLVLDFLTSVFVTGDLTGAALRVIRFVLEAAGVDVNLFLKVIGKAISALDDIMMHPMNFLKNIGGALVMGFRKFWDHIGANLMAGIQGWIFGALAGTGVTPLKDFSLGSVFQLVMQVLGVTMKKIHDKLAKALGPKVMGVVDKVADVLAQAWHWISTLYNKGPAAVWEEVKGKAADLGQSIIAGITSWIAGDLVKAGIEKIAKLSNPAGEIIELIQTIMKTIDFVVTKMNKILAVANAVLDSIGAIVAGNIGAAAGGVEKALVGALSTVIAFLADWLGISNPGDKIKAIIVKVQEKVDAALDWLIAKAISMVQKLFGKDKKDDGKNPKWTAGVAGVTRDIDQMKAASPDADVTEVQIRGKFQDWKAAYGFSSLDVQPKNGKLDVIGSMSPPDLIDEVSNNLHSGDSAADAIPIVWYKPPDAYPTSLALKDPVTNASLTASIDGSLLMDKYKAQDGNPVILGVAGANKVPLQKPMRRVRGTSGLRQGGQAKIRNVLEKYSYEISGMDADHVTDLGFGGQDKMDNLWPLGADVNRRGGSYYSGYKIDYVDKGKRTQDKLSDIDGKWFKVVAFEWPISKPGGHDK